MHILCMAGVHYGYGFAVEGVGKVPFVGVGHEIGAWWAAVYGVAQSWTRLTRLSSSSVTEGQNEKKVDP